MVVVVVEESHKKIRGGGEREGKMREKKVIRRETIK